MPTSVEQAQVRRLLLPVAVRAAIGICPLAAIRRSVLTAISSRSALAAGDTTALPARPALLGHLSPNPFGTVTR